MTLNEILAHDYLSRRALQAVQESLEYYNNNPTLAHERAEFASMALQSFEANGAPVEMLDTIYEEL